MGNFYFSRHHAITVGNPATYQVTPANDSVTTDHLTEQIPKYLKPEITTQPQATNIYSDSNCTFGQCRRKIPDLQWKKDGLNLAGETNATLVLTDANATQHDGNYSVVVSNDFGSVESYFRAEDYSWHPKLLDGLILWADKRFFTIVKNNTRVSVGQTRVVKVIILLNQPKIICCFLALIKSTISMH